MASTGAQPAGLVGIVVVSHSRALARGAVQLAREMLHGRRLRIEIAAGLDDTTFGTDAAQILEAITNADSGTGVVVLMDLGSAVLSAELALELLDEHARAGVLLCPAPLVEGLIVAAVAAAAGADRDEVAAEALGALAGKASHLGAPTPGLGDRPGPDTVGVGPDTLTAAFVVTNAHGLHARPAARVVQAVRMLDARVALRNSTTGSAWVPAASLSKVATLGALHGHDIEVRVSGHQGREALDHLLTLAARGFDDDDLDPSGGARRRRRERSYGRADPAPPRRTDRGLTRRRHRPRMVHAGSSDRPHRSRRRRPGGRVAPAQGIPRHRSPTRAACPRPRRARGRRGRSGDLRRPPATARRRRPARRGTHQGRRRPSRRARLGGRRRAHRSRAGSCGAAARTKTCPAPRAHTPGGWPGLTARRPVSSWVTGPSPLWAVVHHCGRKSGRDLTFPVAVRPTAEDRVRRGRPPRRGLDRDVLVGVTTASPRAAGMARLSTLRRRSRCCCMPTALQCAITLRARQADEPEVLGFRPGR